jgi:plastocyanin
MARIALLVALAALSGCGGGTESTTDETPTGACEAAVHGCSAFTDISGSPTVTFTSFAYSPRCAQVSAGQTVTFTGDFAFHPIQQTCGPVEEIISTASGGSLAVTFETAGTYGYWCTLHNAGGSGMAGAILVVP